MNKKDLKEFKALALSAGFDIDAMNDVLEFGNLADQKYHTPCGMLYANREDYTTYNVYKNGKVLASGVCREAANDLDGIKEEVFDEDGYRAHKSAYVSAQNNIENIFKTGMFILENVVDNPKAEKAYSMAWERGHSSGFHEVANEFIDLVELIK